jgi:tetratricopeptide (TPR) repeat protein
MRLRFSLIPILLLLGCSLIPLASSAQTSYYEQGKAATDDFRRIEFFTKALEGERTDGWVYFYRAYSYYNVGRYDKAAKDFQAAEKAPGNLPKELVNIGLGWCKYKDAAYKEGILYANKSIEIRNDRSEAYSLLGWCKVSLEDYAGAVSSFDRFVSLEPQNAYAYSNRAYAQLLLGNYEKVIEDCDKALAISPNEDNVIERKAVALLKLGRSQEGIALVREKINFKQDDPRSLSNIGDVFYRNEDYKMAIDYHTRAIALYDKKCKEDREYIKIYRDDIYNIYMARGQAYAAIKDNQRALADYKHSTVLNPEAYRAWHEIGELQTFAKNWTEGAQAYERAFAIKPDLKMGWVNLGFCYDKLGQAERAIDAYTRGIKNNPNVGLLYNNRGFGYLEMQRLDEAYADLKKAIEVEPMIVMSHVSLGEYFYARKMYDEGIAKFTEALKMEDGTDGAYTAAYFTRGLCYFDQADWEKAKLDFIAAIKLTPDHVLAHEKLGITYYNLKAYCDSYKTLRRTLDLESNVANKQAKEAPKYMGKMTTNPCNK